MSVRIPSEDANDDFPVDDATLGRLTGGDRAEDGEPEPPLSRWRAALPTAGPADARLLDAVTATVAGPVDRRRFPRLTTGVAAGLLLAVSGVTAAAAQAGPDSPLWPITQLVFGDLADSRTAAENADDALRGARTAAEQGRAAEAGRLLDRAAELTDRITEAAAADRVRGAIAAIRELLESGAGTMSRSDVDAPASRPRAPTTGPAPTGSPPARQLPPAPSPDPEADPRDHGPPADRPGQDLPSSGPSTEPPADTPPISLPPEPPTSGDPTPEPAPTSTTRPDGSRPPGDD